MPFEVARRERWPADPAPAPMATTFRDAYCRVRVTRAKTLGTPAPPRPSVEMVPCLIEVEQNGLKMTKKAMCPKPK